ncbi:unnamed protein product [Orchesella dallaii]|uniref:Uncharacterized protein n=1 Tax=Orchesella dallaii TaxID=48710 RepID=A0ABP1PWN6_9HEXA
MEGLNPNYATAGPSRQIVSVNHDEDFVPPVVNESQSQSAIPTLPQEGRQRLVGPGGLLMDTGAWLDDLGKYSSEENGELRNKLEHAEAEANRKGHDLHQDYEKNNEILNGITNSETLLKGVEAEDISVELTQDQGELNWNAQNNSEVVESLIKIRERNRECQDALNKFKDADKTFKNMVINLQKNYETKVRELEVANNDLVVVKNSLQEKDEEFKTLKENYDRAEKELEILKQEVKNVKIQYIYVGNPLKIESKKDTEVKSQLENLKIGNETAKAELEQENKNLNFKILQLNDVAAKSNAERELYKEEIRQLKMKMHKIKLIVNGCNDEMEATINKPIDVKTEAPESMDVTESN